MPPYAGMRKGSLMSTTSSFAHAPNEQRRTNSGRAVRANTTRPANYYARPFALNAAEEQEEIAPPLGFFPAVTFFTDAISALPREVVRHFTLMKEVEAKIHGPAEKLGSMCDELMKLPVPTRRDGQLQSALVMSFTAPNSTAGSANASLINGINPNASRYGHDSAAGSVTGEETAQETDQSLARRKKYAELRAIAHTLLPNMDEKNVVLAEAIRVMNSQLARIDSVMPHVEAEIPEEARLGSMTHWAYADNRVKSKAAAQASRRDLAAAHNLAAAAHAVHETEIAAVRSGKDARADKVGRGKNREHVDSEFEDKPRKATKGGKGRLGAPAGLGITNGEPVKRRKVEKGVASMERQVSNLGRGVKTREVPRSTPVEEKKTTATKVKSAPPPLKRRGLSSAQASPALASSPLQVQIPPNATEAPGGRAQSARLRQNSSASNLRHERLVDEASRPGSATVKSNGSSEKSISRKRTRDDFDSDVQNESVVKTTETKGDDSEIRPAPSRSNSSNKTPSGGASKVGTPRSENFPSQDTAMARTRSTRSGRGADTEGGSQKGHRRNGGAGSMSGLMKQIAPFNRSPDLDRRRSRDGLDDNDDDSDNYREDRERASSERRRKSVPTSRPVSRHASNVHDQEDNAKDADMEDQDETIEEMEMDAQPADYDDGEVVNTSEPPALIPDAGDEANTPTSPSLSPAMASYDEPADEQDEVDDEPNEGDVDAEEVDEDADEPDPDDPDEPKYCYCLRGSYGDMVGCDNNDCPREWFHLGCTELKRMPTEEESWYCEYCKPAAGGASRRRGAARGRGRT